MALPPRCYVCEAEILDLPGELLVDFEYEISAEVRESQQKLDQSGWVGHRPSGSEWFCARHAAAAEKRSGMPLAQALSELRAIAGLEARLSELTHDEARELVRAKFEPGWTFGTFCLDDRYIVENDAFYVFAVGAREDLVDGDESYAVAGGVTIVYKEDGRIDARASVEVATDPTIRSRPNPDPTLKV